MVDQADLVTRDEAVGVGYAPVCVIDDRVDNERGQRDRKHVSRNPRSGTPSVKLVDLRRAEPDTHAVSKLIRYAGVWHGGGELARNVDQVRLGHRQVEVRSKASCNRLSGEVRNTLVASCRELAEYLDRSVRILSAQHQDRVGSAIPSATHDLVRSYAIQQHALLASCRGETRRARCGATSACAERFEIRGEDAPGGDDAAMPYSS